VLFCVASFIAGQSTTQEYLVVPKPGVPIGLIARLGGVQVTRQISEASVYLVTASGNETDVINRLKAIGAYLAEKNVRTRMAKDTEVVANRFQGQQQPSAIDRETLTTFFGTTVLKSYVDQPAVYITELINARNISTGAATKVAYIDTGVDFDHPALKPWLDPGVDLVSNQSASELTGLPQLTNSVLSQSMASLLDDRFSFILNQSMASLLDGDDVSPVFPAALGHGTLVAGIIHLVAPEARIVPIKAFDAYGNTTLFTLVQAVYAAQDLDVDVINMSFSLDTNSTIFARAMNQTAAVGIVAVASVGNDASEVTHIYPAAYPTVVGVTATDFGDHLATFANYGSAVSVAAPGAYVVSTVPGGRYAAAWGTSFSAPFVSGAVALLTSRWRAGLSNGQTVSAYADLIDQWNPGFERKIGRGRINVWRSLNR